MKNLKIKNKLREIKRVLAPLIVIALVVLAFIQLYFTYFVFRPTNDECLWFPKYEIKDSLAEQPSYEVLIYLEDVKKDGVTWNAGIRDGDRLLALNGKEVNSLNELTEMVNRFHAGEYARYKIARGDSVFTVFVRIKKLIPIRSLSLEIFALIWLIAGFIVYTSKPDGEVQNKFFNIGILWTLSNMAVFMISYQFVDLTKEILTVINFLWIPAIILLPVAIVDFFWTFPVRKPILDKKISKIIFFVYPTVMLTGYFAANFLTLTPAQELKNFSELMIYGSSGFALGIALIIGYFSLLSSYKKIDDPRKKRPLKIILWAYFISLMSLIYVYLLANVIAGSIYNHPEYYLPVVLAALLPVAFAYTIFRYSLMDASSVVINAFLYFVASLFIAGVYFFFIVIIGGSFIQAVEPIYQGLIVGLLFVMFVVLFQSTKDKFQEAITRRFYPEQLAFKEALIKFSREIPSVLSLESVLEETRKIFTEALKFKLFALGLKNENGTVKIVASSGVERLKNATLKLRTENCLQNGEDKISDKKDFCFESENFGKIFENPQVLSESGIQTLLPLLVRGKPIGFIFLGVKQSGAKIAREDLSVLSAAANQVGVALENARMYEAEKKEIILKRDLEKARNIQRSLLPHQMPKFANAEIYGDMLPAQWVGGDYYDVIKIDENRFYTVLGDVSGKGFSAAFYMSKLQTMVRLLADEKLSPAEMLKRLNEKIYPALEKNYFITLGILLFDLGKRTAQYARAGHTPLKILRDGETKDFLPRGIAVGLDEGKIFNANLEEVEIPLNKNDIFLLFSDGVSEEMNLNGEVIGEKFLDKILAENKEKSPSKIFEAIVSEIDSFKGENERHDDITILLVRITD